MSELTRRVVFAIVAAPLAVFVVLAGGAALAGLLAVASALAAWEFFRLARATNLLPMEDVGIPLAGLIPLFVHARYLNLFEVPLSVVMVAVLALLAAALWMRGVDGRPLGAVAATVLGVLYTGGMLSFAYAIRYHPYAVGDVTIGVGQKWFGVGAGGILLLLPLLLTWSTDIGAFYVGRAFGRRKLMPLISPGKTIAGAWGGIGASILVTWAYVRFVMRPSTHLALTPWGILTFAIIVSVAAQLGDLVESMLKREAGVKDASHLVPGHGGVLDRLDSLLFALPVSYVLLTVLLVWAPA